MYAVWGLILAGAALSSAADSPEPTYHSTVSEVRLTLFATDEHNHSIDNLRSSDLAVVDNEFVVRKFRSFNLSSETNLDLVVLVDSSQSVLPHFRKEITEVLQLISQAQWTPDDNVSIVTFDGMEPHTICAGNCRSSFSADRAATLSTGGDTPLFDAMAWAARFLMQRRDPAVRPVIILFSDGEDTSSKVSAREAFEDLVMSEAQVYAVDVNRSVPASSGTLTLKRMAEVSGGRYVSIGEGAVKILHAVLDDLHSAYVLTYAPPASVAEFHSVRVLPTRNLNLQFRCRRGYYHPGSNDKKRSP